MFSLFQRKNRLQESANGFKYRLALDIGTEFMKAVIIECSESERNIVGFGRVQQRYGDMTGGAIANIQGVLETAKKALEIAESTTPHVPTEAMAGIAGEFVKGIVTTITEERENPAERISIRELEILVQKAQQLAFQQGREQLVRQTGIANIEIEMVNTALVDVRIDGYKVTNPYQFQGKNIAISLFNTYAPLVNVGPLATVVEGLGLKMLGAIAEPYAIATSILNDEAYEFGAIVVDIGGGTMDVALIRNGGIEGTEMMALGGRSFTRKLAREFNITLKEAEALKLGYSNGLLEPGRNTEVELVLTPDLQLLYEGLELSLESLSRGSALPPRMYFCGGGSALRGLMEGITERNLYDRLPFFKEPEIYMLRAEEITGIADPDELMKGEENVTPRSLALQTALNNSQNLIEQRLA